MSSRTGGRLWDVNIEEGVKHAALRSKKPPRSGHKGARWLCLGQLVVVVILHVDMVPVFLRRQKQGRYLASSVPSSRGATSLAKASTPWASETRSASFLHHGRLLQSGNGHSVGFSSLPHLRNCIMSPGSRVLTNLSVGWVYIRKRNSTGIAYETR